MTKTIAMGLAALLMVWPDAGRREGRGQDHLRRPGGGLHHRLRREVRRAGAGPRIKGTNVRITKDPIVVTDKEKKEVYGSDYTLESDTCPARIRLVAKLSPGRRDGRPGA